MRIKVLIWFHVRLRVRFRISYSLGSKVKVLNLVCVRNQPWSNCPRSMCHRTMNIFLLNVTLQQVVSHVGLYVQWDGNSRVEVKVTSDFKNNTCGLCGNYNGIGTQEDEFLTPTGNSVSKWTLP